MSIIAVVTRIAAGALASRAFRAFGARVAFAVLHRLAARTDNTLDDELVQIAEDLYYGRNTSDPR